MCKRVKVHKAGKLIASSLVHHVLGKIPCSHPRIHPYWQETLRALSVPHSKYEQKGRFSSWYQWKQFTKAWTQQKIQSTLEILSAMLIYCIVDASDNFTSPSMPSTLLKIQNLLRESFWILISWEIFVLNNTSIFKWNCFWMSRAHCDLVSG